MADRTFEVNITTAVQAPYTIKNAGYAGEHNATAIKINLPAEYIGGFTYSLDLMTGGGEPYQYPLALGEGDDFLIFELPHPLTDKGALDFQLKITETATGTVVKTRGVNLQLLGRDISVYAELAEDYVPDTTATEDALNAAALANLKAGLAGASAQAANEAAEQAEEDVAAALLTMEENLATFEDVTQAIGDCEEATLAAEGIIADCEAVLNDAISYKQLSFLDLYEIGKNKFNKYDEDILLNTKFVDADPMTSDATGTNNSYGITGYIPVVAGWQLYVSCNSGLSKLRGYAYYDADKVFITGVSKTGIGVTITVPSGAAFVRIVFPDANLDDYQVEVGSAATTYESYKEIAAPNELLRLRCHIGCLK